MAIRERIVKLLERNSGKKFAYVFGPAGYKPQPEAIEKWTDWVMENCADEAARQLGGKNTDVASLRERLAALAWDKGNTERGRHRYSAHGRAQRHTAATA